MDLSKTLAPVHALHSSDGIAVGNVYVGQKVGNGPMTAELEDGKNAVLQTQDGEKLELTTPSHNERQPWCDWNPSPEPCRLLLAQKPRLPAPAALHAA